MANRQALGRRAVLRVLSALGLAGAAGAAASKPAPAAASPGHELVGSWVVSSPGPATRILYSFTVDGCSIVTDNEHPRRTPSHGAWMRVGDRQFVTRHMAFHFEPAGAVAGRVEVRVVYTIAPDGQSMEGSGYRYEYDPDDNLVQPPIPIQARATRIEPLLP